MQIGIHVCDWIKFKFANFANRQNHDFNEKNDNFCYELSCQRLCTDTHLNPLSEILDPPLQFLPISFNFPHTGFGISGAQTLDGTRSKIQGSYYFAEFIFPDFSRQNE